MTPTPAGVSTGSPVNVMRPSQFWRMLTNTLPPSRMSSGRALFADRQYCLPSIHVEKENWESRGVSSACLHSLRVQGHEGMHVLLQLDTNAHALIWLSGEGGATSSSSAGHARHRWIPMQHFQGCHPENGPKYLGWFYVTVSHLACNTGLHGHTAAQTTTTLAQEAEHVPVRMCVHACMCIAAARVHFCFFFAF